MARDANDYLQSSGTKGLRKVFDAAEVNPAHGARPAMNGELETGSDNEIAKRVAALLQQEHGNCIGCEGSLWAWGGTHWAPLTEADVFGLIERFDGARFPTSEKRTQRYRLNEPKRQSISKLLYLHLLRQGFFEDAENGINCLSGFIRFSPTGDPDCVPHAPDQKQRHVLAVDWDGQLTEVPPEGSYLGRLGFGCFGDDPDGAHKQALMGEALACAALRLSTKLAAPKALVLYGPSAENGKSQWSELFQALLPQAAVQTLAPRYFGDKTMIAGLASALLNVSDELSGEAIHSDVFKQLVTGEPVAARPCYGQPVSFRCRALHVYSANELPPFTGGMDRGVRRRLLVVEFNRTIPVEDRVPDLGKLIARLEGRLVLSWVVASAVRLLQRGRFDPPASSAEALDAWITIADPVSAFIEDEDVVRLTGRPEDAHPVKTVYRAFVRWAKDEGLSAARIPEQRIFTSRLKALGHKALRIPRHKKGNIVQGLVLVGSGGRGDA